MLFDTVLLELEGVLADTHAIRRDALVRSLADDGVVLTDAAYDARCAGFPVREAAAAGAAADGRRFDDTALDLVAARAERYFADQLGKGVSLAPGSRELLESLAGRVRLGIVTRASRRDVDFVVGLAGLDGAFECVVAAEDVRSPKPSPEPYERAFERLARRRPVRPISTLALEDAAPGVLAARALKLRCIAVGARQALHAVHADAYLPSLAGQSLASLNALLGRDRDGGRGGPARAPAGRGAERGRT
jgi:HAD superfamily hydrolase (TIGR01509 family)